MSKIRINELARELEVKPGEILRMLPELGVTEKKTHSSSLDDHVVEALRRHFGTNPRPTSEPYQESLLLEEEEIETIETAEAAPAEPPPTAVPEPVTPPKPVAPPIAVRPPLSAPVSAPVAAPPKPEPPPVPAAPPPPPPPAPAPVAPAPAAQAPAAPAPVAPPVVAAPATPAPPPAAEELKRPVQPLRPPLAGRAVTPPVAPAPAIPVPPRPSAPPPPPTAPAATAPPPGPSAPVAPRRPPIRPPVGPESRAPGTPAAPSLPQPPPGPPSPRPGQILSGPRQPLPPGVEPARPAGPGLPPPRPQAPPSGGGGQQQRSGVVGQPPPRPVVPPRPDLVARLQAQRTAAPGQPSPRPGAPAARTSPVPGQPIYRGPLRPNLGVQRGPGMPGAPAPGPGGRPQRGRGMHPTAPLPEPPPPPPGDARRHPQKAGHKPRERELEEGRLRPVARHREEPVVAVNKEITIGEGITVKELAEKLGIKASLVIKKLVDKKIFATINQTLDVKLAEELVAVFGATSSQMTFEEESTWEVELTEETADQVSRAPVVTVMGHVDHGKTSLLDAIRQADVAAHEAGGITQHIGAYQVTHKDRKIVFIDTPGHEAFTRMRARGARVTDIVILVVAADDGVMPQTLEAIDHAKAAKVPIIVAINKIDKPDAQVDRIKQQLSDRGLLAEDWGGDTVMVPVSAKAKQNIDLLLEMILLVTEMQALKANPTRPAICTVLEAKLDRGRGPVATILVRNGTLRVGDQFICGTVFSRVRALVNDHGESVRDAEPATPVEVLGLESLPDVGDTLQVVTDTAKAKQIVMFREHKAREQALAKTNRLTLETLHKQLREGETKELNLIIKADVGGSAEVLSESLQKLSTEKVRIKVLHTGVGAITETDVLLASASDAIVIGFNVRPERTAAQVAEQENVDIRLHTIIYDLTQEIKKAMSGLLEPVIKETYRGRAEVREVFKITKVGVVAGCMVLDGNISRGNSVRLLRDNIVIHTGKIAGLRRFKDDVSEVKTGFECGISLENFGDIKPKDILEAFLVEKIAQEVA